MKMVGIIGAVGTALFVLLRHVYNASKKDDKGKAKAKAENKSLVSAAGASVAGMLILGPVGIVGGAFVHGKEVNIPVGTEVYIQIKEQAALTGI